MIFERKEKSTRNLWESLWKEESPDRRMFRKGEGTDWKLRVGDLR